MPFSVGVEGAGDSVAAEAAAAAAAAEARDFRGVLRDCDDIAAINGTINYYSEAFH